MHCEQLITESPLKNFTYILYSDNGENVFCIDPWDGKQVIDYLKSKNLVLKKIINTHEHFDHIRGNDELLDYYKNIKILVHKNALNKVSNSIDIFHEKGKVDEFEIKKRNENKYIKENKKELKNLKIEIDNNTFLSVLETPGHTFAHLSLLLYHNNKEFGIFSGDTFFNAGVGNCYNGGDALTLYNTIFEYYENLNNDVLVFPGHDYLTNNLAFTLFYENNNLTAKKLLDENKNSNIKNHKSNKLNTISNKINSQNMIIENNFFKFTNIGLERDINLFLRLNSKELVSNLQKNFPDINENSSPKEIFLRLRELRNKW